MFLNSYHENLFETIVMEHFKNYFFVNILSITLKYIFKYTYRIGCKQNIFKTNVL